MSIGTVANQDNHVDWDEDQPDTRPAQLTQTAASTGLFACLQREQYPVGPAVSADPNQLEMVTPEQHIAGPQIIDEQRDLIPPPESPSPAAAAVVYAEPAAPAQPPPLAQQ